MTPIGVETLPVGTSIPVGLTLGEFNFPPGAASLARVRVENANVRYWEDGTLPTSTSGNLLYPGDELDVYGGVLITAIHFIALDTPATLQVTYWR